MVFAFLEETPWVYSEEAHNEAENPVWLNEGTRVQILAVSLCISAVKDLFYMIMYPNLGKMVASEIVLQTITKDQQRPKADDCSACSSSGGTQSCWKELRCLSTERKAGLHQNNSSLWDQWPFGAVCFSLE